jgi:hypothetical protein
MQQHHSDVQRRHSGCYTTLPQVSHRSKRQDQIFKGPSWCRQDPPDFMTLLNHDAPLTQHRSSVQPVWTH